VRLLQAASQGREQGVSIHAPTRGATNVLRLVPFVKKFQSTHPRGVRQYNTKAPDEEAVKREKALYEKIGRLEVEVDFCKRVSEQLGILKPSKKS